jgi:hypothetical protein
LPIGLKAKTGAIELTFTDALDPKTVDGHSFDVKVWGLIRSKNYGSKQIDEKPRPNHGLGAATLFTGGQPCLFSALQCGEPRGVSPRSSASVES